MPSYPNQRTVETQKEICDKDHPYATNNLVALQEAMNVLSGNNFKLWMYFAKNQNGFKLECSPVEMAKWGIPVASYKRAFKVLEKLGYLENKGNSYFVFHEKPLNVSVATVEIEKEEFNF